MESTENAGTAAKVSADVSTAQLSGSVISREEMEEVGTLNPPVVAKLSNARHVNRIANRRFIPFVEFV
jgi:hypothetical protein